MSTLKSGHLGKTVKHSAIYAIGTILRRITALVMLPIYTRYLTPSDYGAVELMGMAIELMSILIGMRISSAVFRYYILAENEKEKREVVSTILMMVLLVSGIGVYILYVNSGFLATILFGNTEYVMEFELFVFTMMTNSVMAVCLSYIRARQKPILFVFIGALILCLQVIFNLLFVVHYEMHVLGVVYGALISSSIVAIGLSIYVFGNVGINYSRKFLKRLINFVAPLMLAALGVFYVAYADKYFIRVFSGLSDVGLYSLAGRVGSILMMVFEAFNLSWDADRFAIYKKDNAKIIFGRVFLAMGAILIFTAAGLSLFSADLFTVMTQPEFYSAAYIVPPLVLVTLTRIAFIYCSFGIYLEEKTRHLAEASWLKACVATFGYIVLIPIYGVYGAAFTLLVATMVQLYWAQIKSMKYYDMELDWKPIYLLLSISTLFVVVGLLLPKGEVLYFVIRVFMYLALALCIYYLPLWKNGEREVITDLIYKIIRKERRKLADNSG